MPIEIKELHIKAIVGSASHEQANAVLKPEDILVLKKEIVNETVKRVFELIQQKNER